MGFVVAALSAYICNGDSSSFIKLFLRKKRGLPLVSGTPRFSIDNQFSLSKLLLVFLLDCFEALLQICQNVVDMLDTDGQTNGGRCDAGCQQFFLSHLQNES